MEEGEYKGSEKKSNCAAESSVALGNDSHIRHFLFQRETDSMNACVHTYTLGDQLGCRPEPVTVSAGEPASHLRYEVAAGALNASPFSSHPPPRDDLRR